MTIDLEFVGYLHQVKIVFSAEELDGILADASVSPKRKKMARYMCDIQKLLFYYELRVNAVGC